MDRLANAAEPVRAGMLSAMSPIDEAHLNHMTFGDAQLAREVLALFDRQATMLLARMQHGDATTLRLSAHTLVGSARGVGAGAVAEAAARVEAAVLAKSADLRGDLAALSRTVADARAAIADVLHTR